MSLSYKNNKFQYRYILNKVVIYVSTKLISSVIYKIDEDSFGLDRISGMNLQLMKDAAGKDGEFREYIMFSLGRMRWAAAG